MASLDFIYDATDKLKKDKIDYIIIAVQKGKGKKKAKFNANIFLSIPNRQSKEIFKSLLDDTLTSLHTE